MSKELQTIMMSKEEAEICVREIRHMSGMIRANVVELYEREGWRVLDYDTFADCVQQEFGKSAAYMYRQLATGVAEKRLPIGDIGFNRESHMRPLLTMLSDDEDIVRAWELAYALSDAPTADEFRNAASCVIVYDNADRYPELVRRLRVGDLSASHAYEMLNYMKASSMPDELANIMSTVSDPKLVPMLNRMYNEDTETWQEIVQTGCIPSALEEQIPLSQASASNLRAYLSVASNEHAAAAIAGSRAYWDALKEATDNVITEARSVCYHQYDEHKDLENALSVYDSLSIRDAP